MATVGDNVGLRCFFLKQIFDFVFDLKNLILFNFEFYHFHILYLMWKFFNMLYR